MGLTPDTCSANAVLEPPAEGAVPVSFQGVVKRYGTRPILRDVSLDLGVGECVGLLGVNGAGKSTLLRCLLDLVELDGGAISIAGLTHRTRLARQPLAYLPERFLPPYFARGAEFLRLMAELHGFEPSDEERKQTLALLELDPVLLQRPVRELSMGTAQKLGLAAVLLSGKPIWVLDEPMTGLDPRARARLRDELRARCQAGVTLLFSTHLLGDVDALCDRIALLHRGTLAFVGTQAALCARHDAGGLEQAFLRATEPQVD